MTAGTEEEPKGDEMHFKLAKDISKIYCIDISDSMQGILLECEKQTIVGQIEEMHQKYPERMVTFSDLILVITDGSKPLITLDH
jgi:hypothetical protein